MQFKIVNAGSQTKTTKIKCLIYGDSGAGKSFLAASAPKPLILLTEPNGQASIMHSNPSADLIHISNTRELGDILKSLSENPKQWEKYDSLIIDSLTEVQRLCKDDLTNKGRSPMKLQDWGKLADFMRRFMRALRQIPKHIVCLALLETQLEEGTGTRFLRPAFEGKKTSGEIAQFFNFVGFLYANQNKEEKRTYRYLMLEGNSQILCKPTFPLTGTVKEPNISSLFKQITGAK
jgi:phage nucleotide-binding protein